MPGFELEQAGLAAAGEIVDEKVFTAGKGVTGLPYLQAVGIGIKKDVQARLRFQGAYLVQERALDQQAEAAQVIDFQPFAAVFFVPLACKGIHWSNIDVGILETDVHRVPRWLRARAKRPGFDKLKGRGRIRHRADHVDGWRQIDKHRSSAHRV